VPTYVAPFQSCRARAHRLPRTTRRCLFWTPALERRSNPLTAVRPSSARTCTPSWCSVCVRSRRRPRRFPISLCPEPSVRASGRYPAPSRRCEGGRSPSSSEGATPMTDDEKKVLGTLPSLPLASPRCGVWNDRLTAAFCRCRCGRCGRACRRIAIRPCIVATRFGHQSESFCDGHRR
jgi:hypothetical protein